jgi:hypothetical protein
MTRHREFAGIWAFNTQEAILKVCRNRWSLRGMKLFEMEKKNKLKIFLKGAKIINQENIFYQK